MSNRGRRAAQVAVIAAAAGGMGFLLRSVLPPFVLDDPFWRDFWSGPPVAGLFAVLAAVVAFYPAHRSTRIARETAAREQWWKRAEWALGLAISDSQADREVANDALVALMGEATETEGRMIVRTIANLQDAGDASDVDTDGRARKNGQWRRWLQWRT